MIHRWKKTALFLCETVIVSNYYRINLPPQIFSRISEIRPFKSSPIWLKERFSLVSVCIKKKQWQILWKRRNVTLFRCRALRRCCAPCGPIWLEETSSVVSAYMEKKLNGRFKEKLRMSHCFVVERWQGAARHHHRSNCVKGSVWWVPMWNKKHERFDQKK